MSNTMALDRQRILGELGSVMKQLQNADCGCLGKLFDSPQNTAPQGGAVPTCGGCRRTCYNHGYCPYNSPTSMNQPAQNMNSMPINGTNSQQPISDSMFGYGPQIVNMMRGDHSKPMNPNMSGQGQGQLPGPMVIDAPQSPHGKVGLTPFTPSGMSQQRQFDPASVNQGNMIGQMRNQLMAQPNAHASPMNQENVPGHMQHQFMAQPNAYAPLMNQGNVPGQMRSHFMAQPNAHGIPMNQENVPEQIQSQFMTQPNVNASPMSQGNVPGQMQNQLTLQSTTPQSAAHMSNMTPWPQQNMTYHAANQMPNAPSHPHGQHSLGIAKFNEMFPGVKQGMGGGLGFDPMAIAIQMNPNNKLQSAVDTMNTIMTDNKGIGKMLNNSPIAQPIAGGNLSAPQNPPMPNNVTPQNPVPEQVTQNGNEIASNQRTTQNPNQLALNSQNTANMFGQPIPQQNQQLYAANTETSLNNQKVAQNEDRLLLNDQQQYQEVPQYGQEIMNLNANVPNLPTTIEEASEENQNKPEQQKVYSNEITRDEILREPIFPADASSRHTYMPSRRHRNYGYNTLGQPVEMLPAKMYHADEPSLPQTLSPQSKPEKPRTVPIKAVNVKATISKTSLMGMKPIGRTPSRNQLQEVYNQYKGSQSFTQQNVRNPDEATYSVGRLNIPRANITKAPLAPVERVGGDTVMSNPPSHQMETNKGNKAMEQIGDVPSSKAGDVAMKEAPMPMKKGRNGLQDVTFSSYPTTTAWTFHGHGLNELTSTQRYRSRHY